MSLFGLSCGAPRAAAPFGSEGAAGPPGGPSQSADLVFTGAVVVTGQPDSELASAVAVRDGKVVAVGSAQLVAGQVGPQTRVIDLEGALVLPGLTDAHAHLDGLGTALATIDLRGTKSYAAVLEAVGRAGRARPEGWILGRGWDQNDWADPSFPEGKELERVAPGRAVWLRRIDGHAGVASPAALAVAGVEPATVAPAGGRILRDSDGRPTGVLVDNAMALIERMIPAPTATERQRRLKLALRQAVAVGLTGVHDMGVSLQGLADFRALAAAGELPLRVYAAVSGSAAELGQVYAQGPQVGELLTVRAVKLFADGALGSRGAALLADYRDDPGNRGLLVTPPGVLADTIQRVVDAGFQPCVHAIGDRANRLVLDAYERAVQGRQDLRPRVEHAQVLAPEDVARFAAIGAVASMQPTHATSDMPWAADRLGSDRLAGAYAWRSLAQSGARLAFGSDFPVERPQVLAGLFAAMTRTDEAGQPPGGWLPEQRLSFAEAVAGFTGGAAYAAFVEQRRGAIAPGQDADLTILAGPGLVELAQGKGSAQALLTATIRATVVAGRIVYE
ncbi:MAG: amidohydrolase [Deltaproteobacteria bacterium]|nr:amidohydrolase [Deltaproteobacteria bacterium]